MQNFSGFLNMFFNSQFFSVVIIILILVLLTVLSYLIKAQKNQIKYLKEQNDSLKKTPPIEEFKVEESIPLKENIPTVNTEMITSNLEAIKEEKPEIQYINPIESYEKDEEENAIISASELETIEKERDEIFGKEASAKLIEEYEEDQEKKAIISYNELLKNASTLELNYIEKPKEEDNAPIIKQVEVKDQPVVCVSYTAEEEYLKILKDFRMSLMSNG